MGLLNIPDGMNINQYLEQYIADPLRPNLSSRITQQDLVNKGLLAIGMAPMGITKAKTAYELAHEVAQKNATKMLGLPKNNTAMDRAKAMGFDTPAYHGTADDVARFDLDKAGSKMKSDWGKAVSATPSKRNAEYYAIEAATSKPRQAAFDKYEQVEKQFGGNADETFKALSEYRKAAEQARLNPEGANIMPLMLKSSQMDDYLVSNGMTDEFLNKTLRLAENNKSIARIMDNPTSVSEYAIYNPSQVRSRFAAFDPARLAENDLLAGLAPYLGVGGLLGLGYYGDNGNGM